MAQVEFFGETFAVNDDVNPFALLEFAEAAADGQDGETLEGLASVLRLAVECIAEPEGESQRARFRAVARKNRADVSALVPVIREAIMAKAERPTGRQSDSSDGPPATAPKSESNISDKVAVLFPGRPDMQLALIRSLPETATA